MAEVRRNEGGIVTAIVWMFVLSVLLFWLPVIGPLIAGLVGGRKSGGLGNAIAAVFLPAIVLGVFLFAAASAISGVPLIGAIAAGGGFVLALVGIGPLFLGAVIGGLFAKG